MRRDAPFSGLEIKSLERGVPLRSMCVVCVCVCDLILVFFLGGGGAPLSSALLKVCVFAVHKCF